MARLTSEDAKAIAYIVAGLGGVGIVAYFVYSLANPGPKGGSCTTPGTPCYEALQPYIQEFNTCFSQYAQLLNTIVNSGNAPTDAQTTLLKQLRSCMDDAASNIAKTAYQYVPDSWSNIVEEVVMGAVLVVMVGLGLSAVLNYLKARMANGQLATKPSNGAGIAALVFDAFTEYGAENGLLTSTQIAAWETSVGDLSTDDISGVGTFYNSLLSAGVISAAAASAAINAETASIATDASSTIAALSALPQMRRCSYCP